MALTSEQIDDVLARFSAGDTMISALRLHGADWAAWCRQAQKDRELTERWHVARKDGCHAVMEQIRDIANGDPVSSTTEDESAPARAFDPARARVALDALKFYVSRVHREAYGDSVDLNVRGTLDMRAILLAADRRVLDYERAHQLEADDAQLLPAAPPPRTALAALL